MAQEVGWCDSIVVSFHVWLGFSLFYQLCLVLVNHVIGGVWKAVGWVVLHENVVHVNVHGEVMLWFTTEHGGCGLSCMQQLWSA